MKGKKILLADDNDSVRRSVGYYLKTKEFEMEFAADGEEALQKMGEFMPDLVLLDIRMPKMNGMNFLKEISGRDELKHIPIIVITAVTNLGTDFEFGGRSLRVLQKPFRLEQLLKEIYYSINVNVAQ